MFHDVEQAGAIVVAAMALTLTRHAGRQRGKRVVNDRDEVLDVALRPRRHCRSDHAEHGGSLNRGREVGLGKARTPGQGPREKIASRVLRHQVSGSQHGVVQHKPGSGEQRLAVGPQDLLEAYRIA